MTGDILTIVELLAQYAASGYATDPKYYQIRFEEKLITWEGLLLWLNTQDAKRDLAVFENTKTKILSIKKLK